MFEVTTTGKNLNYGKPGQKRYLGDNYVANALKNGWIEPCVKYIGSMHKGSTVKKEISYMPIVRLNAVMILERQLEKLDTMTMAINMMRNANYQLLEALKNRKGRLIK